MCNSGSGGGFSKKSNEARILFFMGQGTSLSEDFYHNAPATVTMLHFWV